MSSVTAAQIEIAGAGAALERIASLARNARPRAGRTRVIAVDGRSGSGKTTLATRLAERLDVPLVSLEYLYGGWDGLSDGVSRLVDLVLAPLASGRVAAVPHFDWQAQEWVEPWSLAPGGIVVVEGVGAGARAVARYLSLLVWLEVPTAERQRRAFTRDGDGYVPFWDRWARQEDELLASDDPGERADIVVTAGRSDAGLVPGLRTGAA